MQLLKDSYKKTGALHHAYVVVGDVAQGVIEVTDFVEKTLKHSTRGNPDFWLAQHDVFGIDEGRLLKETQQQQPLAGSKKVFVIGMRTITQEAQNSLLKVLEEPTSSTHIFFVLPSAEMLLPTLRSRVVVAHVSSIAEDSDVVAKKFLSATPVDRFKIIAPVIEDKDRAAATIFLNALEKYIREEKGITPETASVLQKILEAEKYLYDRSSSLKMLLEYIAVTV
ncbi:MAG: hypothetical protein WC757_03710 [Candidatus Paceibacterota bacterium]|jgi:DNA polymerase III delta prime subunit